MTAPILIGLALREDDAAPLALGRAIAGRTGAPLALASAYVHEPGLLDGVSRAVVNAAACPVLVIPRTPGPGRLLQPWADRAAA